MNKIIPILLALFFSLQHDVFGQTYTIGTGTTSNTGTSYPAPYGNYYWGAKHQFIYYASELIAAGATAGSMSQMGFNGFLGPAVWGLQSAAAKRK